MRLADLNPQLWPGRLLFDCPMEGHTHRIVIPIKGSQGWEMSGELPNVTVHPSIRCVAGHEGGCRWHGFVTNGEVSILSDSYAKGEG